MRIYANFDKSQSSFIINFDKIENSSSITSISLAPSVPRDSNVYQTRKVDTKIFLVNTYLPKYSHLARRTFIGNIYKLVKDPNLVSALTGHVEGSRAFTRYRTIDIDMKKDLVKILEGNAK